jgi:hypothetical protein
VDPETVENGIVDLDYCSIESFENCEKERKFFDHKGFTIDVNAISHIKRVLLSVNSERSLPCKTEIKSMQEFPDKLQRR